MYAKGRNPECLKAKIAEFSQSPLSCKTGASLKQYTFQGKTVYVFAPGNCGADMASSVVDEQCKNIGSLGGFTGNMKVNGEDFSSATYVKTIWSN
ncbi:MAG: hypothetical protein JNL13_05180 [Chitinophagaceae bacterium]|nr:hypothetical protein [Chitinophagaceae bacterium]